MSSQLSRTTVYAVMIFVWMGHLLVDLMIGIWPVYKSMMELDLAKAGMIAGFGALIGEGSQLIFGPLSDKGYRHRILILGVFLSLCTVFLAYFSAYSILFLLYMTTCIGSGAFHPAASGLVNSLIPERRGLLMTILASGGCIGLAASQLIYTSVYHGLGNNIFFLAFPTILLCVCLAFYKFPTTGTDKGHSHSFKDCFTFFKRRDLTLLYFSQVANQTLLWGTIFILPDALKSLGHSESICFGGGHLCLVLGTAALVIPSGFLADRYSARSVMLVAGVIAAFAFYFMLYAGALSSSLVLISLLVLGAALGVINPVAVALGNRYVPDKPSTVSAFLMGMVWCVSEAIGPGTLGILSSYLGEGGPLKALAILGSLFVVHLATTYCLPTEVSEVNEAELERIT